MRKLLFWLILPIAIVGCGSVNPPVSLSLSDQFYTPSPGNGYRGRFGGEPGQDFIGPMRKACDGFGGLDMSSIHDVTTFNDFYRRGLAKEFRCYGPPASTYDKYREEVIEYEKREAAKRNNRDTVPRLIDETTSNGGSEIAPENKSVTLDAAKADCEELGFKPKTEAFGNCVLKLTE